MNFLKRLYSGFWDIIANFAIQHCWPFLFEFAYYRDKMNLYNKMGIKPEDVCSTRQCLTNDPIFLLLSYYLKQQNYEFVKTLIDNEVVRNKLTLKNNHYRMLYAVASNNHIEILRYLPTVFPSAFEAPNSTHRGDYNNQILQAAVEKGFFETVKYLCDMESFNNNLSSLGKANAFLSAATNGHIEILRYLPTVFPSAFEAPNFTYRVNYNNQILQAAVEKGFFETVKYLCDMESFNNNLSDLGKANAFRSAATNGHIEILRYLGGIPGFIKSVDPFYIQANFNQSKSIWE
jgi:hypothetical protein